MIILADLKFYSAGFKFGNNKEKTLVLSIIYNDRNNLCLNKKLINFIESEIEETESFQAMIKEKFDNGKIISKNVNPKIETYSGECLELYNCINKEFLIPLRLDSNSHFENANFSNLVTLNENEKLSVSWIVKNLLSKDSIVLSFKDFENDLEIKNFINNVYSISKFNNYIEVFNRDLERVFLDKFKGNKINYYVYFKNFSKNRPYLIDEAKELKKNLGSNIKIHFTQNPRIIHERKIFIENLCITFDNSFQNITTTEPTWTIIVEYSEETKNDWLKKASSFKYFYH
jgi:hypothetical protein